MFHLSQEPQHPCCRDLGLDCYEGPCHIWALAIICIISHFYILLFLSFWWLELSFISSHSLPSGKRRHPIFPPSLRCRDTEGAVGSWKLTRRLFHHAAVVWEARICFPENDQTLKEKRAEFPTSTGSSWVHVQANRSWKGWKVPFWSRQPVKYACKRGTSLNMVFTKRRLPMLPGSLVFSSPVQRRCRWTAACPDSPPGGAPVAGGAVADGGHLALLSLLSSRCTQRWETRVPTMDHTPVVCCTLRGHWVEGQTEWH